MTPLIPSYSVGFSECEFSQLCRADQNTSVWPSGAPGVFKRHDMGHSLGQAFQARKMAPYVNEHQLEMVYNSFVSDGWYLFTAILFLVVDDVSCRVSLI
jgi:hypothetical protein